MFRSLVLCISPEAFIGDPGTKTAHLMGGRYATLDRSWWEDERSDIAGTILSSRPGQTLAWRSHDCKMTEIERQG